MRANLFLMFSLITVVFVSGCATAPEEIGFAYGVFDPDKFANSCATGQDLVCINADIDKEGNLVVSLENVFSEKMEIKSVKINGDYDGELSVDKNVVLFNEPFELKGNVGQQTKDSFKALINIEFLDVRGFNLVSAIQLNLDRKGG